MRGRLSKDDGREKYAVRVADVNRGGDDVCRLWTKHACPHGAACRFEHPPGLGGLLPARAAKPKKCLEFRASGKCSRGDACPFRHVAKKATPVVGGGGTADGGGTAPPVAAAGPKKCFNWVRKGKCRKGDRCKYDHS